MMAKPKKVVANTKAPMGSYAVTQHEGGKTVKKYPVDTLAHARNALSRVAQFGSSSEKAAVKAKVKARFPDLAKRSSVIQTPKPKKGK